MATIKAAGDTWSVRIGERPADPELQAIVFFCVTNNQRPYRVLEVRRERIDGPEALESLSAAELRELFDASSSLDYPRTYS